MTEYSDRFRNRHTTAPAAALDHSSDENFFAQHDLDTPRKLCA
jgi:hypothetical protein